MRYRVIGSRNVKGSAPGSTFEADLEPFEEAALLEGGHIEEVRTHRFKPGEFTEEPVSPAEEEEEG